MCMMLLILLGEWTWEFSESPKDVSLRGIAAESAQRVWVSGAQGTVARSTDGGHQWTVFDLPDARELDFRDIEVLAPGVVIVMSAGNGAKSQLFGTWDDGSTWRNLYVNPHEAGFFNAISFIDDQHGLALSDPVDGTHFILRTRDSGQTWLRVAGTPATLAGEYGFAASGTNLFTGSSGHVWIATGGTAARLFHSADAGQNWTEMSTPAPSGRPSAGLFSISFWDDQRGVAVGGDYEQPDQVANNALLTRDGGKNWMLAKQQPAYRSCVRYSPSGDGMVLVAVGRSGCSLSVDGGDHWRDFGSHGFYTLSFAPDGSAWAAGAKGQVARLKPPQGADRSD